jgi:Zn-dependent M28 family amino/carboxypeptidase
MRSSGTPARVMLQCSIYISLSLLSFADIEAQNKPLKGIDASLAMAHVQKLVSFGPRPPSSPGLAQAQSYITSTLKKLSLQIEHQDFMATTPNGKLGMKNILAKSPGEKERVIILGSHYDTRLMPSTYFVGANDGGSSTGLLLELARVISQQKRIYTIWFVFFDGEEAQKEWTESDSLYGSRYFVESLKIPVERIKAMILMDMIGDKDLVLEKDLSSTPWLLDLVWNSSQELGYAKHLAKLPKAIVDDHIPFIRVGIPAVDLIDYDFGFNNLYWHTANDTLDKISSESLRVVGAIVLRTLDKLDAQ